MGIAGGEIKMLFVDDDSEVRELVAHSLERQDDRLSVETASSAAEGAELLSQTDFDCVVSDYVMPGTDGLEFLNEISDLPFILYTGRGSEEVASEAIAAGVTDYIPKGGDTNQYAALASRVASAVDRARDEGRTEAYHRLGGLLRDVNKVLVRARCRTDLEREVCHVIAASAPHLVAWIGERDLETEDVQPRASAGDIGEYLTDLSSRSPRARSVVRLADDLARERDLTVFADLGVDTGDQHSETERVHGFRSAVVLPLEYGERRYGVLYVYSTHPEYFGERDRDVLSELSGNISHALHRLDVEQARRRFEQAIEQTGHAVFLTDREGTIEYVNPAFERITGYSEEEAVGRNPRILKSGEMGLAYYEALWECLLDGGIWEQEVINRRKDGELYTAHQTISPIFDSPGELAGFLAIQADITADKDRERQLRESEARLRRERDRLDEFAGVVSHDLRNPLNVAMGRMEILATETDSAHVEPVLGALVRMEEIIQDTLLLARQGQTVREFEQIDVTELARQCWDSVETGESTLDIDEPFTVSGDRDRLKHVFENLFSNAIEHAGHGASVRVGPLDTGGFYIEDNGPGIPSELRDEVFTPGHRSRSGGTGLGLTIVRRIVQAHFWDIELTESETGGARFEITDSF